MDFDTLNCGMSDSTLQRLENYNLGDQVFSLLLDEVHLKPCVTYNKTISKLDGLSDMGNEIEQIRKVTKCALTFIIRSVSQSIKIPLCFF